MWLFYSARQVSPPYEVAEMGREYVGKVWEQDGKMWGLCRRAEARAEPLLQGALGSAACPRHVVLSIHAHSPQWCSWDPGSREEPSREEHLEWVGLCLILGHKQESCIDRCHHHG